MFGPPLVKSHSHGALVEHDLYGRMLQQLESASWLKYEEGGVEVETVG